MEVGEPIAPANLVDISDECPFDHELEKPPEVQNNLVGKGSTLASSMNSGRSTMRYKPLAPDKGPMWGMLPQKRPGHVCCKPARCVTVRFSNGASKDYPVSCSAHHLVPSQESLKGHGILQYMCKKGAGQEHNHGYGGGVVWSDVGYDTNGSENGVYLPGNYAVGGGKGGLNVWYPIDGADDEESDEGYIEPDKLPPEEYRDFLLTGEKGQIRESNACWQYVFGAVQRAEGQFHDRHLEYSKDIVKAALTAILDTYQRNDIEIYPEACGKCRERADKLKDLGRPAPYSIVKRLETISARLRGYLGSGSGRLNVFTSLWMKNYMEAIRAGGSA